MFSQNLRRELKGLKRMRPAYDLQLPTYVERTAKQLQFDMILRASCYCSVADFETSGQLTNTDQICNHLFLASHYYYYYYYNYPRHVIM